MDKSSEEQRVIYNVRYVIVFIERFSCCVIKERGLCGLLYHLVPKQDGGFDQTTVRLQAGRALRNAEKRKDKIVDCNCVEDLKKAIFK